MPGFNPGTVAEARPLTAAQDSDACLYFGQRFARAIAEPQSDGTPDRDVAYYKWRGYYVVIFDLRPSSDPTIYTLGRDHIGVYNEHFEQVAGL